MTTPTPPAQDGERERLIAELDQSSNDLAFSYRGAMRRGAAMLHADAETIRTLLNQNKAMREAGDVIADELAALRAQVEGLRKTVRNVLRWAEQRCPCENEEPKVCPLCDAKVDDIGIGGRCKAVPVTFPPTLLSDLRYAANAAPSDAQPTYTPVLDEDGNETGYHKDSATGEVVTLWDEYDEHDDEEVSPEQIAADNALAAYGQPGEELIKCDLEQLQRMAEDARKWREAALAPPQSVAKETKP